LNPTLHPPGSALSAGASAPLKLHMKSGELVLLDSWSLDAERIQGTGVRYSVFRVPGPAGPHSIPVADVALFETNSAETVRPFGLYALAVMTTMWGTLTAVCVSDPKSCFGSCPTFYVEGEGSDRPRAEGFSASIARALEARDVDALWGVRPTGPRLAVLMRNEALETHAVRRVRLLAVPRPRGGRVLAGVDGRFHPALELLTPAACAAPEGDCAAAVGGADERERASPADAEDLAAREVLELTFPAAFGPSGIVIGARQTLLSTYLFYQTLAYLGHGAGEYLAALERGGRPVAERAMGMARALGGIDVSVAEGGGDFRGVGSFDEAGPIAGDVRALPFQAEGRGPVRVRLRLARGHWRLDYVALARLGTPVRAVALDPESVERDGRPDRGALATLRAGERHLVTLPGDTYRLAFDLPGRYEDLELFLESEGFYYEWLRSEWLAEEDPGMAALIMARPDEALRRLAGPFKQREAGMERTFWASRFRK
jgi:hypothetical protein